MTPLEYYQIYLGMQLHFQKDSYSYLKYGAKKVSENAIKRFYLLLKNIQGKNESKEDFEKRLIGIFRNKVQFITELYSPESERQYTEYLNEINNWSYYLQRDMETIVNRYSERLTFKSLFFSDNEFRLAPILNEYESSRINYHSLACLASIIPFCDTISPMLFDNIKFKKYMELHIFNKPKIAKIVKPFVESFKKE